MTEPVVHDLGWDIIAGRALLDALRRCADGEDPDLVYAELYVNASRQNFERDES